MGFLYVLGTMLRERSSYAPQSRASILIGAFRWLAWKAGGILGAPRAAQPQASLANYSGRSVFLIGVTHGLGAETPTQLMIFLLAANLGGIGRGFLGLGMFLAGLVTMNMLMTASAVGLFGATSAKPRLM